MSAFYKELETRWCLSGDKKGGVLKIKLGQFCWLIHPKPSVTVQNIMLQSLSSASERSAAFNHHNSGWLKCSCQVQNLEHPLERQDFIFLLFLNAIQAMIRVAISLQSLSRNARANTVMKGSGGTYIISTEWSTFICYRKNEPERGLQISLEMLG